MVIFNIKYGAQRKFTHENQEKLVEILGRNPLKKGMGTVAKKIC